MKAPNYPSNRDADIRSFQADYASTANINQIAADKLNGTSTKTLNQELPNGSLISPVDGVVVIPRLPVDVSVFNPVPGRTPELLDVSTMISRASPIVGRVGTSFLTSSAVSFLLSSYGKPSYPSADVASL